MLHVVTPACAINEDQSGGTIVLESDITSSYPQAIEELQSTEARRVALGYAAQIGIPDPRINGMPSSPYPINAEGYMLSDVLGEDGKPLPPQHPRMQIARYRADIPITRKLV